MNGNTTTAETKALWVWRLKRKRADGAKQTKPAPASEPHPHKGDPAKPIWANMISARVKTPALR
jgi:hypothetical protein